MWFGCVLADLSSVTVGKKALVGQVIKQEAAMDSFCGELSGLYQSLEGHFVTNDKMRQYVG